LNNGSMKPDDLTGYLSMNMLEGFRTAVGLSSGQYHFMEISGRELEQATFNPVDFEKMYWRVVFGEERLPFIRSRIEAAVVTTDTPDVYLLPAGKVPPNPSELIGSTRMAFLLENLTKKFDRVLIDSPPILPASDALILAPQVDGVVLVVKAGGIRRTLVNATVDHLRHARANIVGVVLNQVNTKRDTYYQYHQKYYAKYYGEQA